MRRLYKDCDDCEWEDECRTAHSIPLHRCPHLEALQDEETDRKIDEHYYRKKYGD